MVKAASVELDTDDDGIPDDLELANGLEPNDVSKDSNMDVFDRTRNVSCFRRLKPQYFLDSKKYCSGDTKAASEVFNV